MKIWANSGVTRSRIAISVAILACITATACGRPGIGSIKAMQIAKDACVKPGAPPLDLRAFQARPWVVTPEGGNWIARAWTSNQRGGAKVTIDRLTGRVVECRIRSGEF